MATEKTHCWGLLCKEEIEVQVCCSDYDGSCGCRGLPVDPPFCSEKCYTDYMNRAQNQEAEPFTPLDLD